MRSLLQMWPIILFAIAVVTGSIIFWTQGKETIRDVEKLKEVQAKHDKEISGICGWFKINRSSLS